MRYIEKSQKIRLTREATQEDIKQALLNRLRRAFSLDMVEEREDGFHIRGTTGGQDTLTRHAQIDLEVSVAKTQETVRIISHGRSQIAKSLMITYSFLFLLVLFAGLLPGSIETSGEGSGALDALVFIIFGIFTFYDINKKVSLPEEYLQAALQSLDTEFG